MSPLSAYGHAVVRAVGAVLFTAALWREVVHKHHSIALVRQGGPLDFASRLSDLWGVKVSGDVLRDTALFAVSRVESPLVWGPLVAAGVLAVAVECHRRGVQLPDSVQG